MWIGNTSNDAIKLGRFEEWLVEKLSRMSYIPSLNQRDVETSKGVALHEPRGFHEGGGRHGHGDAAEQQAALVEVIEHGEELHLQIDALKVWVRRRWREEKKTNNTDAP